MKIETKISFGDEVYTVNEAVTYTRDVQDLDVEDALEYALQMLEHAGFDLKSLSAVGSSGQFYSTME